jgi:hypothetical protein
MGTFSLVVFLEPLFEIIGQSHVPLLWRRKTFGQVHLIQVGGPPTLKLRRASCFAQTVSLVLRSASAKQDGWGGIRTPGAFRHTRFPGVHNRPLCHPSSRASPTVVVICDSRICFRLPQSAAIAFTVASDGTTRRVAIECRCKIRRSPRTQHSRDQNAFCKRSL